MAALLKPMRDDVASLSPKALELLEAGCAHPAGRPNQLRSDNVKFCRELKELEDRGFMRRVGLDPWITDEGRAAIGAPSEREVSRALFAKQFPWCVRRPGAVPAPIQKFHGRSVLEYQNLRTMRAFCVPVFRHAIEGTVRMSRDGGPAPHVRLPQDKFDECPESRGDLLLICVSRSLAKWVQERQNVNLFGDPPPLSDQVEWTQTDRDNWALLCAKANSINIRIRDPFTDTRRRSRAYGESA